MLECYNFIAEPDDEDENPRSVNIPESEGTRNVDGPKLEIPAIIEPIKIKKINIGIETEPKFASIGDYWDDEMVGHIADLLHDYQAVFHGDSPPRVGDAPPSLPAPRGLGGFWGNVSQRPQN